jgi:hypothetical protein
MGENPEREPHWEILEAIDTALLMPNMNNEFDLVLCAE